MPVGLSYSDYLVTLIAEAQAASARIATADPPQRTAAVATSRKTSARLSARLDASPLDDETADAVDAGALRVERRAGGNRAPSELGWARALKLDGMPTRDVAAAEYANLLAAFDAEHQVARRLFSEPGAALAELHGLVCESLVEPSLLGALRSTPRAVHDGAQGMMIYAAPEPDTLPSLFASLTGWLGASSAARPDLVLAGVVHERILEWQPFEAGNGRVARAAARVVLRARELDPDGIGVAERLWAADPSAYHAEVAATKRRRGDLSRWLERHAEAVVDGLERAAAELCPASTPAVPDRGVAYCRGRSTGTRFTMPEYAAAVGVGREIARADLTALRRAGRIVRQPGSRGLRFRVP